MSKFIPVLGTKEQVSAQAITEGFTYFETDTGKIFVDTDGERILFGGGGVKILYSSKDGVEKSLLDNTYYIPLTSLTDKETSPSENDLIIVDDGRFFKVLDVSEFNNNIHCELISISSTGGSGSGGVVGPGDGPGTQAGLTIETLKKIKSPYVYGQKAEVSYRTTAANDPVITYSIIVTNISTKEYRSDQESIESGQIFTYDFGPLLYEGMNNIKITISGTNDGSQSYEYTPINCIRMELKESPDFNPLNAVSGALEFKCMPFGNISKTLKIYIDGEVQPNLTKENFSSSDEEIAITIPPQTHGVHKIKAVLSTGSGALEVATKPLEYEIA